jgi:zinc/manganese transport system ATP-binding protein
MRLLPRQAGEAKPAGRAADCDPPPVLCLRDAAAALGGRTIWQHATFEVRPGEFIAVVGQNGCGKSTLLRMILGQVRAAAGEVRVLGGPPRLGNRAVGLVPQHRELTSGLAVRGRDLVLLGIEGKRWGFGRPSAAARRQADWALEAVNAREFADEAMGVLSGGEQQRLLIAQVLSPELKLLLLDEPLASLDLRSQHEIVSLVDGLRRRQGVAVLFVSHDLNPVLPVVDRVLYFLNRCPVCGGVDDVVQPELLTHLFGTPVQVCRTHDGGRLIHGATHRRRDGHLP